VTQLSKVKAGEAHFDI
jgi:hypothetical protein